MFKRAVVTALAALLAFSPFAHADKRPAYRIRVSQELQVMQKKMNDLEKRPMRADLRPRIEEGMTTLRGKYAAARAAFERWQQAPGEIKRRKAVDSALVDVRKFYTKVVNRFRG